MFCSGYGDSRGGGSTTIKHAQARNELYIVPQTWRFSSTLCARLVSPAMTAEGVRGKFDCGSRAADGRSRFKLVKVTSGMASRVDDGRGSTALHSSRHSRCNPRPTHTWAQSEKCVRSARCCGTASGCSRPAAPQPVVAVVLDVSFLRLELLFRSTTIHTVAGQAMLFSKWFKN